MTRGGVLVAIALPLTWAMSLGTLAAAYRAGYVSPAKWAWLTDDPGPMKPLVDVCVHGHGPVADAYATFVLWCEQ